MNPQIDHLAKYPEMIPTLAKWHDKEWRHLNPASYNISARMAEYRQADNPQQIPVMLVAHENDTPVGSVRLINDDMETHPELTPWLASLYVHPDQRRQGIATKLIGALENSAKQLGFSQVYLFTEDRVDLYKSLGWQELFKESYYDEPVTVMTKIF